MVRFCEKVVGDGCYLATEGNAGQFCPPLSISLGSECEVEVVVGTYLCPERRFEVFEGDFLVCHSCGWLWVHSQDVRG